MNRQYKIRDTVFTLYETEEEFQKENRDNYSLPSLKTKFSLEFLEKEHHQKNHNKNVERLIVKQDQALFIKMLNGISRYEFNVHLIDYFIMRRPISIDYSLLHYLQAVDPEHYSKIETLEFPLVFHGAKTGRWTKNKSAQLNLHGLKKYKMEQEMDEIIQLIHEIDDPTQSVPLLSLTPEQAGQLERGLLVARPNHHFVMADWSSIELVIMSYLLRETEAVEMLETEGQDFYMQFGLSRPLAKKMLISYIYGMSYNKLREEMVCECSEDEFQAAFSKCQRIFSNRTAILTDIDDVMKGNRKTLNINDCVSMKRGPRGLIVKYGQYRKRMEIPIEELGEYYPEKLLQNITQAIARERLVAAILESYKPMQRGDFLIKFYVHDEIIFEVPDEKAEQSLAIIDKIMSKNMKISLPGMFDYITIPKFNYKVKTSKHYR